MQDRWKKKYYKWNAGMYKQKRADSEKLGDNQDATATLNHGSTSFIVVDMAQRHHSGNIFLTSS